MVLLATPIKSKRAAKVAVEVIILRSCVGRPLGSDGVQHLELGSRVKVEPKEAETLVLWGGGAAKFADPADDDTPGRIYTVTPEDQAAIRCTMEQRAQRQAEQDELRRFQQAERRALIDKYKT